MGQLPSVLALINFTLFKYFHMDRSGLRSDLTGIGAQAHKITAVTLVIATG